MWCPHQNEMKRTILVGDVHGCLEELKDLLDKLKYSSADRLILLGDLVDKGPDPVGVLRFARSQRIECVLGNHDEKHVRWRKHEQRSKGTGKANPMVFTPRQKEENALFSEEDLAWIKALPLFIRLEEEGGTKWVFLHGGLQAGIPIEKQDPGRIIRLRYLDEEGDPVLLDKDGNPPEGSIFWTERWKGPESVVYGHVVHSLESPRLDSFPGGMCLGLDTGCCHGGALTALVLPSREIVQVQARKMYVKPGWATES